MISESIVNIQVVDQLDVAVSENRLITTARFEDEEVHGEGEKAHHCRDGDDQTEGEDLLMVIQSRLR